MGLLSEEMKQCCFHFLDVGCSGALDEKWSELFPFFSYTGFDPNVEECKRLMTQAHPFKEARYLPYAIHKEKGTFVMYKTESIYCYSLLRPNQSWLNRFSFSDLFKEMGTEPVQCTTLNHLAREEGLKADIMKLDTQGLELPILQSGDELLGNCICVETETGFMENYVGETTYAQIDEFMRSKGFLMFDLSIHRVGRKNFLSEYGRHQPIWCESLWLFDFIGQKRKPSREQAIKALTICTALKYSDYGFELAVYFNKLGVLNSDELTDLSKAESWNVHHKTDRGPEDQAKVIEGLTKRLQESDADRVAQLQVIRDYDQRLQESEADRAARLEVIKEFERQLNEVNKDLEGKLKVIEDLGKRLQQSEADRAARLEAIRQYEAQLSEAIRRLNAIHSVFDKIPLLSWITRKLERDA